MNKIIEFIKKRPVKIILVSLLIIIVFTVGIMNVELKTGNDTLISDKTDIYKENENYQDEFGKEPIILIFEEKELFSPKTLKSMNLLQNEIKDLNGIFTINSPVTIMNQISEKMYQEVNDGLIGVSNTLIDLGEQLTSNDQSDLPDLNLLTNVMQDLIDAQGMLDVGFLGMFDGLGMILNVSNGLKSDLLALKTMIEADPTLDEELIKINEMLVDINMINTNLDSLVSNEGIKDIPSNTILGLTNILNKLQSLSTQLEQQQTSLTMLANALITIGENLKQMQKNFNAFTPSFPKSDETIKTMTHDEEGLRDNFSNFVVSENKIRMVIVLESKILDKEIDLINDVLEKSLKDQKIKDKVLISGKPILDRSIKSSMTDSMVLMMLSAVIIMILVLSIFYKVRLRLLPMIMMFLVVVATIGAMGWLKVGMTMVSMAVFPILIGLGIDYFIQFQTRYEEERKKL